MKRVALCLSGHARTYESTYWFWKNNLMSQYQTDVFIHLWDTVGPRSFGQDRTEHNPLPRDDFDSGIVRSAKLDIDHIVNMWNPIAITIEQYDPMHDIFSEMVKPIIEERNRRGIPAGFEHHHPLSVRSMLYKRYRCNEMKTQFERDHHFTYDLVIQSRTDVALAQPIINDVWADRTNLYFHNCRSITPDPEINDFGAMGTSNQIDLWCNLYNKVDGIFNRIKQEDNFFKFLNPHKMYVQYLSQEGQSYKELDLGLSIVRDSGIVLGWPHAQKLIKETVFHES